MAEEGAFSLGELVNTTDIYKGVWDSIPQRVLDDIYFVLYLGRIILILFIVYIIFLILIKIFKLFLGTKETRILKDINGKLEEMLNILKRKKSGKENGEKKEKSDKH